MKTIDISTTQNVTIEYELASLRDRFFGFFIDVMIVLIIYSILASIFSIGILEEGAGLAVNFIVMLLPIGTFILYQLLSEVVADGQSWGKKAMGTKVVRLDGKEPGFSDYLLRAIFHIIDTVFSLGVVASFLISSSNKNQRLGDMTANTAVIRVKFNLRFRLEDILKINSLDDYEPTYPEVKRLSEKDMLLIKTIISRYRTHRNEAHLKVINELITNLRTQLDIAEQPADKIGFLKTLIRDYIVLTR